MIHDIENGKIGVVLCKDLSRLGRNNALVAYYTEIFFPDNDVRFICVSEGIDTINGDNEIMPFKSVINEYYAKDISRKVRSAYHTKALNGEFTAAFAPYGYEKDPEDKHHLIIDENTAPIVKIIFQMASEGLSPFKIARRLSNDKILTPRAYTAQRYGRYKNSFSAKYPEDWSNSTIKTILKNRVYLGHMVNNKSTTKSFKNRKLISKPKEEWIEIKNTHAPIVDDYLFEIAQKVVHVKKRDNRKGDSNIFAGLLKCSDCGAGLGYVKGKTEGHQGAYNCNVYRKKGLRYCTAHYITYKAIYQLVLDDIKRNAQIAKDHETELFEYVKELTNSNSNSNQKRLQKEYDNLQQRYSDLDTIIKKLFEQNALGIISDERFMSMSVDYETEQKNVSKSIEELRNIFNEQTIEENNTMKFLNIVRKYSEITELNKVIINDLVESIVVYNAEGRSRKNRKQRVEINYKFIGSM